MAEEKGGLWRHSLFNDFHTELGYCVTAWAQVDEELFNIFQRCVGPWRQCAIIFYKIPGMEPRRTLVDEIVRSFLPKPEQKGGHQHPDVKAWSEANAGFSELLASRRRIAHQQVGVSVYLSDDDTRAKYSSVQVFPSYQERLRGRGDGSIDIEGLKKHQADSRCWRFASPPFTRRSWKSTPQYCLREFLGRSRR